MFNFPMFRIEIFSSYCCYSSLLPVLKCLEEDWGVIERRITNRLQISVICPVVAILKQLFMWFKFRTFSSKVGAKIKKNQE